jgi:hypothetical protein
MNSWHFCWKFFVWVGPPFSGSYGTRTELEESDFFQPRQCPRNFPLRCLVNCNHHCPRPWKSYPVPPLCGASKSIFPHHSLEHHHHQDSSCNNPQPNTGLCQNLGQQWAGTIQMPVEDPLAFHQYRYATVVPDGQMPTESHLLNCFWYHSLAWNMFFKSLTGVVHQRNTLPMNVPVLQLFQTRFVPLTSSRHRVLLCPPCTCFQQCIGPTRVPCWCFRVPSGTIPRACNQFVHDKMGMHRIAPILGVIM